MSEIIENVKANEPLYKSIEVIHRRVYRFNDDADLKKLPFFDRTMTVRGRTVLQGDYIFVKDIQSSVTIEGKKNPDVLRHHGYDGDKSREVFDNMANIHHGRHENCEMFRPHNWLLVRGFMCFPLSLWLKGGKELQAHPSRMYADYYMVVKLEGEEAIDGLRCYRIRATNLDGGPTGKPNWFRIVWLAPERNYLMVRTEGFNIYRSTSLPVSIGRAEQFKEVRPGIWLPYYYKHIAYDELALAKGQTVWRNEEEGFIDKFEFDPHYDISLFRDIPIPEGGVVYEIKDGKIVHGYQAPVTSDDASESDAGGGRLFFWLAAGVLALAAAWFVRKRWSRPRVIERPG